MKSGILQPRAFTWLRRPRGKAPERIARRPRTTASWARETEGRRLIPDSESAASHSARWSYAAVAAAVFLLALNVRVILAAFASAIDALR